MNIQTLLIRNNYQISLASLVVDSREGELFIKQTPSQARTDTASVIVKMKGEKEVKQKINTMVEVEGIKEYLSEFYINSEFVKEWKI